MLAARAAPTERAGGERLVMLPATFDMRRAADAILLHARVYPRVALRSTASMLRCIASRQAGIPALLPAIVLRGRDMPGLAAVPLGGRTRRMDFGILWPAADGVEPGVADRGGGAQSLARHPDEAKTRAEGRPQVAALGSGLGRQHDGDDDPMHFDESERWRGPAAVRHDCWLRTRDRARGAGGNGRSSVCCG